MKNKLNEIVFVTGNKGKAENTARLLGMNITNQKVDLPEIQSLDLSEIAEQKLKAAYDIIKKPCMIEDMSLEFYEFKRLPGTLIKFFLTELGLEKLCHLLDGKDRTAIAKCIIGFTDGKETKFFIGEKRGKIAAEPRGQNGYGWDKIFIPDGSPDKTNAELDEKEYDRLFYTVTRKFDLFKQYCENL